MGVTVAIVGDFDPTRESHVFTTAAIAHLPAVDAPWISPRDVDPDARRLSGVDGIVMAPGAPYAHPDGAFTAIRHARERGVPLVGT
jgi:CTP synthase (UTP-ammonia lyase)